MNTTQAYTNSRYTLAVYTLITIWFLTFSTQGVFYQASIYLLPLCILANPILREEFFRLVSYHRVVLLLFLIPITLAFIVRVISTFGESHLSISNIAFDPLVRTIIRIIIFSVCVCSLKNTIGISAKQLIQLFLIAATAHAIASLIQEHNAVLQLFTAEDAPRIWGTVNSPNELGSLTACGAIVAVSLLLMDKGSSSIKRIFYLLSFIALVFCLILTQSRGGWLALAISLIVLFIFFVTSGDLKKLIIFVTFCIVFIILLALVIDTSIIVARVERLFIDKPRMAIWQHFIRIWQQQWLFGTYDLQNLALIVPEKSYYYKNPHSVFLDITVRTGLIGLCAIIVFYTKVLCCFCQSSHKKIVIPLLLCITVSTAFSFSIYAKEFAQSLYAILLMLFLVIQEEGSQKNS